MGRIRKAARWTFSFGGTGWGSPIRAESSAEQAAREHRELLTEQNRLIAEQNRLIAGQRPVAGQQPDLGRVTPTPHARLQVPLSLSCGHQAAVKAVPMIKSGTSYKIGHKYQCPSCGVRATVTEVGEPAPDDDL